ncbi:MAG: hypothetical protein WC975_07235 [Phycisphaerae bacterium]
MTQTIPSPLPFPITLDECPFSAYKNLAHFHYRAGPPGPVDECFALSIPSISRISNDPHIIGIIVYSLPPLNNHLRNLATNSRYLAARNFQSRAQLLNKELRTISRVIIHPQFRSLGLAAALVKNTLPLINTLFVEASAVMGLINPFFQKAGMTMYTAPPELKNEILLAAFHHVGIPTENLQNTPTLIQQIKNLKPTQKKFLLSQIKKYYLTPRQAVFSSRTSESLEWTLPRLTSCLLTRPAYFLWQNPTL